MTMTDSEELMKRRAMNGVYSSDEDEDSEDDQNRSIRNGGRSRLRKHRSRRNSNGSSVLDDPCGVRRKRTFFRSKNDDSNLRKQMGISVPLAANGLTGDVPPEIILNGSAGLGNGIGLGLEGITGGRVTEAPSRANSPGSVA